MPREGRFHEFLGELELAQKQPRQGDSALSKGDRPESGLFRFVSRAQASLQYRDGRQGEGGGVADEERRAVADRAGRVLPRHVLRATRAIARRRWNTFAQPQARRARSGTRRSGVRAHGSAAESGQLCRGAGPIRCDRADSLWSFRIDRRRRLSAIQVTPVLVDGAGRIAQQGSPVVFRSVVQPGQQAAAQTGIDNVSAGPVALSAVPRRWRRSGGVSSRATR